MSETRWLDDREQAIWRTFLDATHLLFAQLDREVQRDAGMPLAYYELLVRLSEAPDRTLRMHELAARSTYSASRLSHAIARLEERGWVVRRRCPEDKRGQLATLTETGFAALDAAAPGHVEGVRTHLLDPLTDAQVAALGAISSALREHLRSLDETGDPEVAQPLNGG